MKRYGVLATKQYRKDYKRLLRSGFTMQKLEAMIDQLSSGGILPNAYRDHPLKGSLTHARECHIEPNWLLLYTKDERKIVLLLLRTGTHRDVLGIE